MRVFVCCSSTRLFTDVVGSICTVEVIPEVVPQVGEEGVVLLYIGQAVLIPVVVVRFSISPVKPLDSSVAMLPYPGSWVMVRVMALISHSIQPELVEFSWLCGVKESALNPVVDAWMIQLSNMSIMKHTQELSILEGHHLSR